MDDARLTSLEDRLVRIEDKVDALLGRVGAHVTYGQFAGVLGTLALIVIGVLNIG